MEVSNSFGRGFQEITSKDAKHKIGNRKKTIQVVILYLLWWTTGDQPCGVILGDRIEHFQSDYSSEGARMLGQLSTDSSSIIV